MQESRETLHEQQNADREHSPGGKDGPEDDESVDGFHAQADLQDHGPQYFGELCKIGSSTDGSI